MSVVDIRIIGLNELTVDIERIRRDASFRWPKEVLDTSDEIMADTIRDEAPLGRTGNLKGSVRVERTVDTRRIIVDSPYGVAVNDGTGPSPGRYVPAIGRRIKSGMHPGVRATHFFDRAVVMATPRILGFVHRRLNEYLME